MIKIKEINKTYNNKKVLNNININFREKELVSILGPSGCGKTTLLNIISTSEAPDTGSIYLGNKDITLLPKKKLDYYRNNYISYIYQDYNLIKYLNIKDNLNIALKIKGQKETKENIIKTLKKLKIEDLYKKKINNLSGGEKQRSAIARSIITKTKIILADEPTGALDSSSGDNIMKILKDLSKDNLVIVVTHNKELAEKYSSRIINIKDGNIINDTNPYEDNINKEYKLTKNKVSLITSIMLSFKNIKNKKIRTYLMALSFSVGLISLALVLSISNGFNKEIKNFEKEMLYNYPVIISKESESIDNIFKEKENVYKEGIININKSNKIVTNKIDEKLFNKIKEINKKEIEGIAYYKEINDPLSNYLIVNPNNNFFNIIEGKYPEDKNEIMLLVDDDTSVSEILANYLNIENVKIKDILGKKITVNNVTMTFTAVVKSNNNYYKETSGIIYNSNLLNSKVNSILIFPSSYESKLKVKEILKEYNIIDDSESVVKIIKEFINGITYILISFSIISLIVSIIMISIISYISILERKKEIGILKTLGARNKDIKKIFLSENLIIGIMSNIFTVGMTYLISIIVNEMVTDRLGINNIVNININIIFIVIILSITLSYVAGIIPSKIAGKSKIVDIINDHL